MKIDEWYKMISRVHSGSMPKEELLERFAIYVARGRNEMHLLKIAKLILKELAIDPKQYE